jgi:hypothetical protein
MIYNLRNIKNHISPKYMLYRIKIIKKCYKNLIKTNERKLYNIHKKIKYIFDTKLKGVYDHYNQRRIIDNIMYCNVEYNNFENCRKIYEKIIQSSKINYYKLKNYEIDINNYV